MIKKILCFLVCLFLVGTCSICVAGDGREHEEDLENIFLGRTLSDSQKDPKKHANTDPAVLFGYLEDAIYLCIDQMGNEGQKWLDELNNDFQVAGLPKSIDEISVPTSEHERYTHLGWDYKDYPLQEKWAIRQNILLATVSKVFDFPIENSRYGNERYSDDCIQLSKLIYYIHILGDHSRNKFTTTTDRIQLRNSSKTRGEVEAGLINELRDCIAQLFWNQRTTLKYSRLRVKLNTVRFRAWINGEEDSEAKHEKIQDIANATLQYMQPHIKELLMELSFYRNVFGSIVSGG